MQLRWGRQEIATACFIYFNSMMSQGQPCLPITSIDLLHTLETMCINHRCVFQLHTQKAMCFNWTWNLQILCSKLMSWGISEHVSYLHAARTVSTHKAQL